MAQWFVFFYTKIVREENKPIKSASFLHLKQAKPLRKEAYSVLLIFFVLFGVGILLRSSFGPAILTRSATMMGLPFQSTVMESASHVDLFPIERIKAHTLHRLIDGCRHDNGKEGKYGCCLAVS